MEKPVVTNYKPVVIDDKSVELPVMEMTGLKENKYLVIPDEYFDVENSVLLGGVTLIPMRNLFDETK